MNILTASAALLLSDTAVLAAFAFGLRGYRLFLAILESHGPHGGGPLRWWRGSAARRG